MLLVVFLATRRVAVTARHLSRWWWGEAVGAGRAFLLIEDLTGSCFEPLPQGLLLHELPDRRSLPSGWPPMALTRSPPTPSLLTFCCLLMAEEAAGSSYLAHGYLRTPCYLVFLLNVLAAGPLKSLAALHRHLFPPVYSQGGGGRSGYLCLVPHLWQLVSSALVSRSPAMGSSPRPTPATSITERIKSHQTLPGSVHHVWGWQDL